MIRLLIRFLILFVFLLAGCRQDTGMKELTFTKVILDEGNVIKNPHAKSDGDLNGDGITDLIIASSAGGPLVWYESPEWNKHTVYPSAKWSCEAEVADLDRDGDNDIIISEWYGLNRMEWYENTGTGGDEWTQHVIGSPRAHDIELADLDGDGDIDIVTRQQGKQGNEIVMWGQESPDKWIKKAIICPEGEGLGTGDIDRDGDIDIIIAGIWYEGTNEIMDGTWEKHMFGDWPGDAIVQVADINGDGRLDVILTQSEGTHSVSWFEAPADVKNEKWTEHIINERLEKGHSLGITDMDNDGDMDVVAAEMHQSQDPDEVIIYINNGMGLSWAKNVISEAGLHNIRIGDFDGDGDTDIFGANWNSVEEAGFAPVELWINELK